MPALTAVYLEWVKSLYDLDQVRGKFYRKLSSHERGMNLIVHAHYTNGRLPVFDYGDRLSCGNRFMCLQYKVQ